MFLIPKSWYTIHTSKKKGRGVFVQCDIAPGTVIGDYLGTLMPRDGNDEQRHGLYDMAGGLKYEIFADPKKKGVQLINHSCANNCDAYPYQGHILYIALRKIFRGEELTVNYSLYAPEENTPCRSHACHCESKFCAGTMHETWKSFDAWDSFVRRQFGKWYTKIPGAYGDELAPLDDYPRYITEDYPKFYNIFASEKKAALRYADKKIPSMIELRRRIRETGRRAAFPKIGIVIDGVKGNSIFAERSHV